MQDEIKALRKELEKFKTSSVNLTQPQPATSPGTATAPPATEGQYVGHYPVPVGDWCPPRRSNQGNRPLGEQIRCYFCDEEGHGVSQCIHKRAWKRSRQREQQVANLGQRALPTADFFQYQDARPITRVSFRGTAATYHVSRMRDARRALRRLQQTQHSFAVVACCNPKAKALTPPVLGLLRQWFPTDATWHYQSRYDGWCPMSRGRDMFFGGRGCNSDGFPSPQPHGERIRHPLNISRAQQPRILFTTAREVKPAPPPPREPTLTSSNPPPGLSCIKEPGRPRSAHSVCTSARPCRFPRRAGEALPAPVPVQVQPCSHPRKAGRTPCSRPRSPAKSLVEERNRVDSVEHTVRVNSSRLKSSSSWEKDKNSLSYFRQQVPYPFRKFSFTGSRSSSENSRPERKAKEPPPRE